MSNERKDEPPAASAEEWPKRNPPTIDLDASEVSGDTSTARGMNAARAFARAAGDRASALGARTGGLMSKLLAPLGGAIAALLVLAAFWAGGLIGQPQLPPPPPAVSSAQFDNVAANVGDLTARLARVETAVARPAALAIDPALASRTDALERALASVREEASRLGAQLRTATVSINELKAAPREGATSPAPDMTPLTERLKELETAVRSLEAVAAKPPAPATDGEGMRRLVAANALDAAVRGGEPYVVALAVAKQVAANPAALAPLDRYAASGIPSETTLLREIVAVLENVAAGDAARIAGNRRTGAPTTEPAQAGILDRLQSGLSKLVQIERIDATATRMAPPQPAANAAVRRDSLASARQDIARLPVAANPQVQAWIASADAREQALAAAQKFSAEALAAFGKSGQ